MATARRNTLPRKSSPKGVQVRQEKRIKGWTPEIQKGSHGTQRSRKPGSENPRKVGR